ncbi:MAG: hypothetical protein ACFFBH_16705 [Promethearchaeota archaeon]
MKNEDRRFILSLVIAISLTMIFTMIPLWQLVIIPGIIAGLFNKSMKRAILSGTLGVLVSWSIYIIYGLITRNVYSLLDQFGALIISEGYGWLLLILIFLFGAIFGALGGGIGNGLLITVKFYYENNSRNNK